MAEAETIGWMRDEFTALRGELRSWLNDAFMGLRSELDLKASELLERQIAVAGLVKVATELQERQFAVAELVEVARSGRRMAELVDQLPDLLTAFAADRGAASRSSSEAQAAVAEVRGVLAAISAAAAETEAKADALGSLRQDLSAQVQALSELQRTISDQMEKTSRSQHQELSAQVQALSELQRTISDQMEKASRSQHEDLSAQVQALSELHGTISDQMEMTSRLQETLARQGELLSLPIDELARHVEHLERAVPTADQVRAEEARLAAIDEVVEQARQGRQLAEAASDLPARVAEAVGTPLRPEDIRAVIRESADELRTVLDGVQRSMADLRAGLEERAAPEEAQAIRALLEELVENARSGPRLAAVVEALPARIDEAVRGSLRAANEASGAGALPMVELGSVLSSVRSSISDLRSKLDEPAPSGARPAGDLAKSAPTESPLLTETHEADANPEPGLPGGDPGLRGGSSGEAPARQNKRFLGRRSGRRPAGDPSPATAGRAGDD